MKDFDYIIIGGGCAGLTLAYELEYHDKLKNKTLSNIEKRDEYKRDKTWSYWKTVPHKFDDCVKKRWKDYTINFKGNVEYKDCKETPYESIDSGLFYKKILNKINKNPNIQFFKDISEVNTENAILFNSLPNLDNKDSNLWQHFQGVEIETEKDFFDDQIMNLMDFDCDQKKSVHFFYTLPYSKKSALIETTWLSKMEDDSEKDYDKQITDYIENTLKLKKYKINYKEVGAIPLFYPKFKNDKNTINIGTAGGMTRLSTGYTFLNIQEQAEYITQNIDKITQTRAFNIKSKYKFLDNVFLKVLAEKPEIMPNIFFKMFKSKSKTVINFLSNKSNIFEDLSIILKMPKWIFIKAVFK